MPIHKNDELMIKGNKSQTDWLWDIKTPVVHSIKSTKQLVNVMIQKDTKMKYLVGYEYTSCFNPPLSTFLQEVRRYNSIIWPGINKASTKQYLQKTWLPQRDVRNKRWRISTHRKFCKGYWCIFTVRCT